MTALAPHRTTTVRAGSGPRWSVRRGSGRAVASVILIVIAILFLIPLLWVLLASFNPAADLRVTIPGHFSLTNFNKVLNTDTTYRPMLNGVIICGIGTLLTVVCSILAGYPLSRYRSRLKRPFLLTILFSTGLPITALMVPVYSMFLQFNLIDSLTGTILFLGSSALPISIWLTKNFMDGVPTELEEAAWTDGATTMQTLRQIVLPLMWPGVTVVAIYTFIGMWGNFFVPFILLGDNASLQPASVSIYTFFDPHGAVAYGQLAAFSILYCIPVIVLYVLISRKLGRGFALGGAVKG